MPNQTSFDIYTYLELKAICKKQIQGVYNTLF